jgi:hypothetical protein
MYELAQDAVADGDEVSWLVALALSGGIGLILVATGLFVISIANRGADGRLAKNRVAGIRTTATLKSDEAWLAGQQAGHRYSVLAGKFSVATGVVPVVIGLVMALFNAVRPDVYLGIWVALLLVGVAFLVGAAVAGAVVGHRAAKAVHNPDPLR